MIKQIKGVITQGPCVSDVRWKLEAFLLRDEVFCRLSHVTSHLTFQVQDALQQADVVLAGALVSGGNTHRDGAADHSV